MFAHIRLPACVLPLAAACAAAPTELGSLELVVTVPVETTLAQRDLRATHVVWPELVEAARTRLDCAWFYVSDEPGSRLGPFLEALAAAAGRGVAVRILADRGFHDTYPQTLDALDALAGVEVRLFDVRALTGGVLHAKYFLVDEQVTFLGSQNCDWRSLEHIQELGLLVRSEPVQAVFRGLFEDDWARAGGTALPTSTTACDPGPFTLTHRGQRVRVWPVASPRDWVAESLWDLPRLISTLDGAAQRVRLQLLTYRTLERDGSTWTELEAALERAAARGVRVELLVADWGKRKGSIEGLQRLAALDGLAVRMLTIPPSSQGFIPFARVIHAKYLVVDGRSAWVGTSNWERSYFYASRNVGLLLEGAALAGRLERYFEDGWNSPYAEELDPLREYEAPRIGP